MPVRLLVLVCVALLCLANAQMTAAQETPAGPSQPSDQHRPFVPRFQSPHEPAPLEEGSHALGFAMLGSGTFLGGLGLFMLETNGEASCASRVCRESKPSSNANLGTAMLIGGVFLSGIGLYFIVSDRVTGGRVVLSEPLSAQRERWRLGLSPVVGGAVFSSDYRF